MGLADVLVQNSDMVPVTMEVFVSSPVLQHPGNGSKDMALLWLQGGAHRSVHNVKTIRSYDGWVHVAIVDQVTYNL